jgi:hypothetical protein
MEEIAHHTNYADLERAAHGGCYLCIRVSRDFQKAT